MSSHRARAVRHHPFPLRSQAEHELTSPRKASRAPKATTRIATTSTPGAMSASSGKSFSTSHRLELCSGSISMLEVASRSRNDRSRNTSSRGAASALYVNDHAIINRPVRDSRPATSRSSRRYQTQENEDDFSVLRSRETRHFACLFRCTPCSSETATSPPNRIASAVRYSQTSSTRIPPTTPYVLP